MELVPNEQEEALIRALLHAFLSFGGVPLCCVFDKPKTVVVARQSDHIQWNETFGQVFLDYRLVPELCTPRSGWEKGAVNNRRGGSGRARDAPCLQPGELPLHPGGLQVARSPRRTVRPGEPGGRDGAKTLLTRSTGLPSRRKACGQQ